MPLASPPSTPPSSSGTTNDAPSTSFDIAAHYRNLTSKDPKLTPAIAAIESLVALLSSNPLTTISETLALVSAQSSILLASQSNPIPLSSGTDLFGRYLVSSFQQRSLRDAQQSDFTTLRNHLISNSRVFVSRAKAAPKKIAAHALPFIREESTIFVYGGSIVTDVVLSHAINADRYFNLVSLLSPTCPDGRVPGNASSIPSTTLSLHAVTYALSSLTPQQRQSTIILVPASAVLEDGSIISVLGAHQLALLAHSFSIPFYVLVESYKFVRSFPLGTGSSDLSRMGVHQNVLNFEGGLSSSLSRTSTREKADESKERQRRRNDGELLDEQEMIEITPSNLITALITENGIMTPAGVSEELIKLWF